MKYNLNQIIWYIKDNRVHSAKILARMTVENAHPDWAHTEQQKETFTPFGEERRVYSTTHGTVLEHQAFASKEELLASL
jgi:hypothetical protein